MDASRQCDLLLRVQRRLDQAPCRAAVRLVRSPATAGALQVLAASPGRVVALGDSLTADPRSWAEILRRALQLMRARFELVNLGVPGDTTVHLVSRFADVAGFDPDLLIVMAGTNDARRHGAAAARMLVPDRETQRNLVLLKTLASEQTRARVVFITPPPVLQDKVRKAPVLRREPVTWVEADVDRKAGIAAALDAEIIDSRAVLRPPLDGLLLADGLHLSLRGQERLARWIVRSLAPS